jgi:hypothetical protein
MRGGWQGKIAAALADHQNHDSKRSPIAPPMTAERSTITHRRWYRHRPPCRPLSAHEANRVLRLSSMTRAPWRSVIAPPDQRSTAAR